MSERDEQLSDEELLDKYPREDGPTPVPLVCLSCGAYRTRVQADALLAALEDDGLQVSCAGMIPGVRYIEATTSISFYRAALLKRAGIKGDSK